MSRAGTSNLPRLDLATAPVPEPSFRALHPVSMPTPGDIRLDLGSDLSSDEVDRLLSLSERLRTARPLPTPTFRGKLRRRLFGAKGRHAGAFSPRLAPVMALSYTASGLSLLVVAALSLVNAGPFAPG